MQHKQHKRHIFTHNYNDVLLTVGTKRQKMYLLIMLRQLQLCAFHAASNSLVVSKVCN